MGRTSVAVGDLIEIGQGVEADLAPEQSKLGCQVGGAPAVAHVPFVPTETALEKPRDGRAGNPGHPRQLTHSERFLIEDAPVFVAMMLT